MNARPILVWFRLDLRLEDNPALDAACAFDAPIVPVFVWSPDEEGCWAPASATRWWLHQSLRSLESGLALCGSRLILLSGPTLPTLTRLLRETNAQGVLWNRRYEPAIIRRDTQVKNALREGGWIAESHNSALLFEPWQIETKQGRPYQVYTPFWKTCREAEPPPRPLPAPKKLAAPKTWPKGVPLDSLKLEPAIDWAGGMRATWTPGAEGARKRLDRFLAGPISRYGDDRDRPDLDGTSSLSPHLHFGEISPRTIWHAICERASKDGSASRVRGGEEVYLKELVWREFAHHLLYHFPHTTDAPLREQFAAFPWREDAMALRAWQRGRTGYPLVDAGMRQLCATGWMHNRIRMVTASFLVKHLLLPWQEGARWFWDTLVDADLASNTLGWQWTAGCGADAAPYFRIFNPISQGEKFDPNGTYVRRWVPELARLPDRWIHRPWEAPAETLRSAGIVLGTTYPGPIVDHAEGRSRALRALESVSQSET